MSNVGTELSISAKLIGIANSAFYGGDDDFKNVRNVIAWLGTLQMNSIIYSLVLSAIFKIKLCPHYKISCFWYKSMNEGTLRSESR